MPYSLFHDRFPDIAERETRTITVIDSSVYNLPPTQYAFLEMFCDEPGCDCRRVFLSVVSPLQKDILAVIAWGWEEREFYIKWLRDDDLCIINDLIGPTLNSASPQSNLAPALLDLFRKVLLQDNIFVERVKRHYALFRREIDNKSSRMVHGNKKGRQKRKKR